jgi:phosphate transport system permease protein
LLFMAARAIGGRGAGQLTPRQQRRRALGSRRDLARYERQRLVRAAAGQSGFTEEEE